MTAPRWCWPTLAAGLLVLALARAQEAPPPARPAGVAPAWDYRVLTWQRADTEAALRDATGSSITNLEDMLARLAAEVDPRDHPALQTAIDQRLRSHLERLGAEGWELTWVRENTTLVAGYVLPAPALYLRRAARG